MEQRHETGSLDDRLTATLVGRAAVAALALHNTIYLCGYGGSFETLFKEKILPPLEAETDAETRCRFSL